MSSMITADTIRKILSDNINKEYSFSREEAIAIMNLPEEEKQVHEITEEVVQEGEVIEDILKSGDPEKIMQLLKKEFAWPKGGWDNWKKKVITL